MELKISKENYLRSKKKYFQENYLSSKKNIFRYSCFGRFLDVKELEFSIQLLQSILLKEVKSDKKAMLFRIGQKIYIFLHGEVCLFIRLNCNPPYKPNIENIDNSERIINEFTTKVHEC